MFEEKPRKTFRELVSAGQVFAPCVWDCYSAKAAELAGFEAILLSGASLGFSMSGVPRPRSAQPGRADLGDRPPRRLLAAAAHHRRR